MADLIGSAAAAIREIPEIPPTPFMIRHLLDARLPPPTPVTADLDNTAEGRTYLTFRALTAYTGVHGLDVAPVTLEVSDRAIGTCA